MRVIDLIEILKKCNPLARVECAGAEPHVYESTDIDDLYVTIDYDGDWAESLGDEIRKIN